MLGLKHTTVKLVPHSYKWHYLFQEEVINLRRTLNQPKLVVEHVGSTALPDIAAKPILDMFIPCQDLSSVSSLVAPLALLGYELVTDGANYKLFIRGPEEARTHHLTFTSPEGSYWQETIQFRDCLLANPSIAKAYEAKKTKLATLYASSRRNYTVNKARFIQATLRAFNQVTPELPLPLLSTHINPRAVIVLTTADLDNFTRSLNASNVASHQQATAKQNSTQPL